MKCSVVVLVFGLVLISSSCQSQQSTDSDSELLSISEYVPWVCELCEEFNFLNTVYREQYYVIVRDGKIVSVFTTDWEKPLAKQRGWETREKTWELKQCLSTKLMGLQVSDKGGIVYLPNNPDLLFYEAEFKVMPGGNNDRPSELPGVRLK